VYIALGLKLPFYLQKRRVLEKDRWLTAWNRTFLTSNYVVRWSP
jgi:hypothetical protein